MSDNNERAWTCINRWRRRGYDGQVEIFEKVMADNERLRAALNADDQTLRLHLGEMTSQEMRTLKAGLKWVLSCAALEGKQ